MAKKNKEQDFNSIEELKKLLESDEIDPVNEFVSTSSTLLDYAISNKRNGGVPVGRITELLGENQAGKTLIATHILTNTQKKGGIGICIDVEHDMDKEFSTRVGLNWDALIYRDNLETIEEIVEYIEKVVKTTRLKYKNQLITIVWDSIAASRAGREIEGPFDPDKYRGLHARLMSAALRRIRPMIKYERIALVCTNQMRTDLNAGPFGNPNTTAHGKAMSFYTSLRVELRRTRKIEDANGIIGAQCSAQVIKNKCGPPWKKVHFPVMYEWGVDNSMSVFDFLLDQKIVTGVAWREISLPNRVEPIKFRTADWDKLLRENEDLRNYAFSEVEKRMTRELKSRPEDFDIDLDSILHVEQVKRNLEEQKNNGV